jgi:hypothetical protein
VLVEYSVLLVGFGYKTDFAFCIVEEEGWMTFSATHVDDETAAPPAETRWTNEEGVDSGEGYRESIETTLWGRRDKDI